MSPHSHTEYDEGPLHTHTLNINEGPLHTHSHTQSFTESENVYNLTPEPQKGAFIVISQVEDYRVQVTITLTSTLMREEPSPEQAAGRCPLTLSPKSPQLPVHLVWGIRTFINQP